jgi:TolB-like protein
MRNGRRPRGIDARHTWTAAALTLCVSWVLSETVLFGATVTDTVAVVPFNVSGESRDPRTLSHGLPELVSGHLTKIPGFAVVDRVRLSEVIQELGLWQTGLIDENRARRTAVFLPASLVLTGTVLVDGRDLHVLIRGVRTTAGTIAFVVESDGRAKTLVDLIALGRSLAMKIASRMRPITGEMDHLEGFTESGPSFSDFSVGLYLLDTGQPHEAKAMFHSARKRDPGFLWPEVVRMRAEEVFGELDREAGDMEKR